MLSYAAVAKEIGKTVLFLGVDHQSDSDAQLVHIAQQAQSWGFDSICVKRFDGGYTYPVNGDSLSEFLTRLKATKQAVNKQAGMGCFFYGYCYGPRFGESQIATEANLLKCCAEAEGAGVALADMEIEYNNQPKAAAEFAKLVSSDVPGFGVTTWADPNYQGWMVDIKALAPYISFLVPQQYTLWLLGQEAELAPVKDKLMPAGSIYFDALQAATQAKTNKHATYFLWDYTGCLANPSLAHAACQRFKG